MERKILINQLELAYSPVSNYEFAFLKHEPIFQNILLHSNLYIIAQRPEISFDNVRPDIPNAQLEFEIRQKGNPSILKCNLPLKQRYIAPNADLELLIHLGSNDTNTKIGEIPANNIH
jgi:hypothetical protein